jgi:hypothetical protein
MESLKLRNSHAAEIIVHVKEMKTILGNLGGWLRIVFFDLHGRITGAASALLRSLNLELFDAIFDGRQISNVPTFLISEITAVLATQQLGKVVHFIGECIARCLGRKHCLEDRGDLVV